MDLSFLIISRQFMFNSRFLYLWKFLLNLVSMFPCFCQVIPWPSFICLGCNLRRITLIKIRREDQWRWFVMSFTRVMWSYLPLTDLTSMGRPATRIGMISTCHSAPSGAFNGVYSPSQACFLSHQVHYPNYFRSFIHSFLSNRHPHAGRNALLLDRPLK